MQSIKQFWLDSELEIPVRLHSIICIVPTHRIESVSTDELFRKQLIYSNKVILNFLDKSTVDQKARALELIHQVNPLLRVLEYLVTETGPQTPIYMTSSSRASSLASTMSSTSKPRRNHTILISKLSQLL
jgi:G3E family GTPase